MTNSYLQAMEQVAAKLKPSIILYGQNDKGMDLAPWLAFRLKTGVVMGCVALKIDSKKGSRVLVKPVFGGKAHATYNVVERDPCRIQ